MENATLSVFAGFTLPRLRGINAEKRAPLAQRLADFRRYSAMYGRPIFGPCGPYQCRQFASADALAFYLDDSATMPGLRYETGDSWTADGDPDPVTAVVFRLPRSRGFLAGWTLGAGMAGEMSRDIYADAADAMRAAESMAEDVADRMADDAARYVEREAARDALQAARLDARSAIRAIRELIAARVACDSVEETRVILSAKLRKARARMRDALHVLEAAP